MSLPWSGLSRLGGLKGRFPEGRSRHLLAAGVVVVIGGLLAVNLFTGGGDEDAEIVDDELVLELPQLSRAEPEAPPRQVEEETDHLPLGMTRDDPPEPEVPPEPTAVPQPDQTASVASDAEPDREAPTEPEPEPEPVTEPDTAPEPSEPEATEPEPEVADAPAVGEGVDAWLARGETWARGQPADHYTIQVLAAGGAETLLPYLSRHGLDDEAQLVLTQRQGNEWYLVLVGSFSDREAARDAMEALPEAVRASGPWVRSLGSVTEVMP